MNAQEIVEKFPGRDKHGYVVGWYLYTPAGVREGGPYPTAGKAEQHRSAVFTQNLVCGLVFTEGGSIVRAKSDTEVLQEAVDEADRAAVGDSNDGEISALRDALDCALSLLRKHADIKVVSRDWEAQ
ncbi:hypothetical protein SEA_CUCURBITA_161 [Gordonia phage Cucurbita]|uniref:Uncharacterized protein n=1 Tax=Gordonia phage ClubL TaxID=1838065 RepID=A0A160DFA3_9CAUD|nr:hypothetical protein BH768_gp044 [Gordonia phage ClubL]YP_009281315.1 hypothetical protein BIZ74_gp044 [Gordonia phage Cucurbita]AUE23668.1 hypothetical protein SEA_TONIANN_162 [Gordonia phage Toniann]QYC53644.1 hypothetical protein SEA_NORVS_160 [Gordonia phage Norvs]WKW85958.1 hypothetical protein SEA_PHINKBODEN_160 [Gordonia Phage PhinkBoden]ANA86660.1 hypothetical protein PBI_CLUBL_163 [Gordonia phage ClubL]AOE44245.1 hypothetical protein SEA_CUCURBITA_161 [Gordonia phage Cucurbita]